MLSVKERQAEESKVYEPPHYMNFEARNSKRTSYVDLQSGCGWVLVGHVAKSIPNIKIGNHPDLMVTGQIIRCFF
jgi:hypothetical protein